MSGSYRCNCAEGYTGNHCELGLCVVLCTQQEAPIFIFMLIQSILNSVNIYKSTDLLPVTCVRSVNPVNISGWLMQMSLHDSQLGYIEYVFISSAYIFSQIQLMKPSQNNIEYICKKIALSMANMLWISMSVMLKTHPVKTLAIV